MPETLDPIEDQERHELDTLYAEVMGHRLAPEDHAKIDAFVAQRQVDALLEEARRLTTPIYVCAHGKYTCGYIFRDGRPTVCPKCGHDHGRR